jgi:hypothetical protein
MQLSIPESIIQSIRLPEGRIEAELLKELALALYAQELLSFGKARELANLGRVLKASQSLILSYEKSRVSIGFKTDPRPLAIQPAFRRRPKAGL